MLKLKIFDPSETSVLLSWIDSEALMLQFAGPTFSFPITEEQIHKNLLLKDKICFGVYQTDNNYLIGYAEIALLNLVHKSARLGRLIIGNKENQNKGFGQVMVQLLLGKCFEELELHRVALNVYDFNRPAISCYLKAGFKIEGLLRDTTYYNGEYWSGYEMSILRHEWKVRAKK